MRERLSFREREKSQEEKFGQKRIGSKHFSLFKGSLLLEFRNWKVTLSFDPLGNSFSFTGFTSIDGGCVGILGFLSLN